jgi:hypothetical protein
VGARMVNENAPHDLSGDAKKVSTILPAHVSLIHQFEKRFVHERGRLKSVIPPFPTQITAREALQFAIDRRQQLLECVLAPDAPLLEQFGDL